VLGALSKAAPKLIPAASSGTMNNLTFGGTDPVRRQPFATTKPSRGDGRFPGFRWSKRYPHAHDQQLEHRRWKPSSISIRCAFAATAFVPGPAVAGNIAVATASFANTNF